jgi:hypothetical protein
MMCSGGNPDLTNPLCYHHLCINASEPDPECKAAAPIARRQRFEEYPFRCYGNPHQDECYTICRSRPIYKFCREDYEKPGDR